MIKFKELYPLTDGIVVIVYSVYQHILLDENARLSQVRQEGILYDKHKQQCRDVASDLSVRIQKLVQQEANGSDPADFGSEYTLNVMHWWQKHRNSWINVHIGS